MKTIKLIGRGIKKKEINVELIEESLLNNFEGDKIADKNNLINEKILNKTIRKVINHNKKLNKPINTHILLKK